MDIKNFSDNHLNRFGANNTVDIDLAKISTKMSQYDVKNKVDISMCKKAQDQVKLQGENFVEAMSTIDVEVNDGKSLNVRI